LAVGWLTKHIPAIFFFSSEFYFISDIIWLSLAYATCPFMHVCIVQQSLQKISGNLGFYTTEITNQTTTIGRILPQLLCRLVGDSASFGVVEDFYPQQDISSSTPNEAGFYLIIVHKGENCSHT
jgi:hypothetical protein